MMVEKFWKLLRIFLVVTVGLALFLIYLLYEPFSYQSAWNDFLVHIVTPFILAAPLSLVGILVCYSVSVLFRDMMDLRQMLCEQANVRVVYKFDYDVFDKPEKPNEVKQETLPKVSTPANAPVATKPKNASAWMRDVPLEDPPPHITEVPSPSRLPSGPTNEIRQSETKQPKTDLKKIVNRYL